MKTLKAKVKYVLEKYPDARNSDKKMINAIWVEFYKDFLFRNENNEWCVKLLELYKMPNGDELCRIRRKIQNVDKEFLPTDPETIKHRKTKEEDWRKFLGYNPELRQV